jgi:PIN domain nuclease of toxin-antitoxin system
MILLDSHVWYWWIVGEHQRLTPSWVDAIDQAAAVGVSPVSCSELALAWRRGRLELPLPVDQWFGRALSGSGIELVPFTDRIAFRAVALADVHRDPFDRIIIATALELDAQLISADTQFGRYPELERHLVNPSGP